MLKYSIFIIFFLQISNCLYAQIYQLSGKVVDKNQLPLKHVAVKLVNFSTSVLTDAEGYFQFSALKGGQYHLNATLAGYDFYVQAVNLSKSDVDLLIKLIPHARQLKEVVVNKNRIELRKQEQSFNVEVVNSNFIQRNLGGSLMKTLERLPGIQTIGIGSGQSKPLIRGLGFNRVVVVEKGVKHEGQQWGADHGLEIDQFAAGEIEILKGAASFIYGSDAIGGVINIKPNPEPPINTIGGSGSLIGKTNNNLYGTSINLFGRKKNWFFDSRFTYQSYGDYRVPTDTVYVYDYAVRLRNNYLRNTAGKETGLHLNTGYVSDRFRSVFYLSNSYNKSGFFANAHGLEPRRVDTELHDNSDRDILMPNQQVNHFKVINRSEYRLPGHQLEMELGYQHNFRQEHNPYVSHGYMPAQYPSTMSIPVNLEREFDKHVYSFNLRDNISLKKHQITIGINGEYQNNNINGWSFLVPAFKQATVGAFIYDKIRLNDQVVLHGALRYDHAQLNMLEYTDWFNSDITKGGEKSSVPLIRAAALMRAFNSVVWSTGINYNLENFSLKANLGKSFRMPIAKELAANGVNYHYFSYEKGDPNLLAEQSYQVDLSLGWKADNWSVVVSPFYNYFPNYIYLNPTAAHDYYYGAGNQVFQYAQSRVMRYGGELHLTYNITPQWSTAVLGEYLYAKQLSGDKKGFALPFSPPPSALLNLTFEPSIKNGFKDSYISFDYRLTGSQANIVPPEKKTNSYQLINVQAGTKVSIYGNAIEISLQAQNLMNKKYLNHTSFYRLISLPEAGRNFILSLTIPFTKKLTQVK